MQRLEGACEPVALRKFIVGELTAIIEGDGQEFLSVVRCDTSFLERFLFAIASKFLVVTGDCAVLVPVPKFLSHLSLTYCSCGAV